MTHEFDVVIIGAGASGVLVAAHLRRASAAIRVALLDAGARAARGLAYGTPYGAHLLNVPAAKMSAYADQPEHFVEWLKDAAPEASAKTFAPRSLYGEYLSDVLAEATAPPSNIVRIPGTVVGLSRDARWTAHLHDGRTVRGTSIVLALGNLPPADPLALDHVAPASYLRDPWAPGAADDLAHDAPILLIGTGLTMIDLALALRAEGHRGPIHAISRRGLLPQSHKPHLPRAIAFPQRFGSPRAVVRWLRREVGEHDWRAVIDALRPVTAQIWQGWTLNERRSFLRHVRPYWDVHRHRTAPEVAAEIETQLREETLQIHRGRIQSISETSDGLLVQWRTPRGEANELRVARVINCTGPASNYEAVDLPLVAQMRRAGWLVPDPLGLGIETDEDGRLIGRDQSPVPGLCTIGPLRRPALWESTAIPEIRAQAAALANGLASAITAENRTTA